MSDPFKIYGFVFVLELYIDYKTQFAPNEDSDIEDEYNYAPKVCTLQLILVKLPVNIASISIDYTLTIKETDKKFSWITNFTTNMSSPEWDDDMLCVRDLEKSESLTFGCNAKLLNVYDEMGSDITSKIIHPYVIMK